MAETKIIKTSKRVIVENIENVSYDAAIKNFREWNSCDNPSQQMAFIMAWKHVEKVKVGDVFTTKEIIKFFKKGYNRAFDDFQIEYYLKN